MVESHSPKLRQRKQAVKKTHKTIETKTKNNNNKQELALSDNVIVAILIILALPIRLKSISSPDQVIFNEVNLGKTISSYIKQTFFFDGQPPLTKLLISFFALFFGFNGEFEFSKVGSNYLNKVPFVQLRTIGALFGVGVVPLAYLTIRNVGQSKTAGIIAALAICFENGIITSNQYILLDSYLLFFTAFTIFSWTKFFNQKEFNQDWWSWLLLTGIGLGCTISTKWAGFLTMMTVGISALKHLWNILGDTTTPKRDFFKHFYARFLCLLIVPTVIYLSSFYIHFKVLSRPGLGDHVLSIESQYELKGDAPLNVPAPVTYGSLITVRHIETAGGFLHSHLANYPEGSKQQQVTLYPYRDPNNWWRIIKAKPEDSENIEEDHKDILGKDESWLEYVRDGDHVILEHLNTAPRKLHSHDVAAPMTETDYHFEVSGYGFPDHEGDSNDLWRVEIDNSTENKGRLESRRTQFRLLHVNQNCYLYSTPEKLPEWGFQQQEVSCIFEGLRPKTIWMIDDLENDNLPDEIERIPEIRPGFIQKVIRLHRAMWEYSDEELEEHPFKSRPTSWPLLRSFITLWSSNDQSIVVLGNPAVYGICLISILTFLSLYGLNRVRQKRGYPDSCVAYENSVGFFVMAWFIHYVPQFLNRQPLFLMDYGQALYVGVLSGAVGLGLVKDVSVRQVVSVAVVSVILYGYWVYRPITYGGAWSGKACESASIWKSWDLGCYRYAPVGSAERARLEGLALYDAPVKELEAYDYEEDLDEDEVAFESTLELEPESTTVEPEQEEQLEEEELEEQPEEEELEEEELEEEEDVQPTDAPVFEDEDPDAPETEEEEGNYPKTVFGFDPNEESEDGPVPATVKNVPFTRAAE